MTVGVKILCSYHPGAKLPARVVSEVDLFKPFELPQDKYFESSIFRVGPSARELFGEGDDAGWVGHLTYSYGAKIGDYDFVKLINQVDAGGWDVVGLRPAPTHNLYDFADTWHPGFMRIWERLVELLGYGDYRQYGVPAAFYCNYWLMRRELYDKYRGVATRAMELLDSDEMLREWAYGDSSYRGTLERLPDSKLVEMCGRPYYTFHPFVMERLVCFFAHAEKLRVKMLRHDDIALYGGAYEVSKKRSGRLL